MNSNESIWAHISSLKTALAQSLPRFGAFFISMIVLPVDELKNVAQLPFPHVSRPWTKELVNVCASPKNIVPCSKRTFWPCQTAKLEGYFPLGMDCWLVVSTPLKNMKVGWDYYSEDGQIQTMFQTIDQIMQAGTIWKINGSALKITRF